MKKNQNEYKLTNWMRIFHPDEYNDTLASYVLRGTLEIRDIPFRARVAGKQFYVYAFRHARGIRDLRLYDDTLACLREDLNAELNETSRWILTYLQNIHENGRAHLEADIYYLQRTQANLRHAGKPH